MGEHHHWRLFSSAICSVRRGSTVDASSAAESRRGKTEPSDRAAVALLHRHRRCRGSYAHGSGLGSSNDPIHLGFIPSFNKYMHGALDLDSECLGTQTEDACPHGASALVRGTDIKERVSASDGTVEQIEQGDGMSSLLDVWGTPPENVVFGLRSGNVTDECAWQGEELVNYETGISLKLEEDQ